MGWTRVSAETKISVALTEGREHLMQADLYEIQVDILSLQVSNGQHSIHTHLCHLSFTTTHSAHKFKFVSQSSSFAAFSERTALACMQRQCTALSLAEALAESYASKVLLVWPSLTFWRIAWSCKSEQGAQHCRG